MADLKHHVCKHNNIASNDSQATDIKLTPYLSKMTTDGESINAKKRTGLKIKSKDISDAYGYWQILSISPITYIHAIKKPAVNPVI